MWEKRYKPKSGTAHVGECFPCLSDLYISKNCIISVDTQQLKTVIEMFQLLNHVDVNLKLLIKSGYYIVPSPSTTLLKLTVVAKQKRMPTEPPNSGPRARLIMKYDPPPGTTPLVAMAAMEMALIIVWKGTKKK